MSDSHTLPNGLVTFGPNANCTLALCSIKDSIYEYRPSLGGNAAFLAIFALFAAVSLVQGIYYRKWSFMIGMVGGSVCEVIGYAGRLIAYNNPFSFAGFLIQIILITIAPAFYTAAIYMTLSLISVYLGPEYGRLPPQWYYYIFIPCDIVALALQATGGGMSAGSSANRLTGVKISKAGLIFQVVTLFVFMCLCVDYSIRCWRGRRQLPLDQRRPISSRFKLFAALLTLAMITIFTRCIYRVDELSDGYDSAIYHDQGLFIGLEGVMVVVGAGCLVIGHPGPVFGRESLREMRLRSTKAGDQSHADILARREKESRMFSESGEETP